jgi:Leucine-rich repeat (LRR) protein
MQAKETLTTLCGLSREETALDFSGQYLVAGDAVLIANDISDMRAMTRLNLSKNQLLTKEGGSALGNMLKTNTILKELDVSDSHSGKHILLPVDGPGFAMAISEGLAGNRMLTKLDVSNNNMEQGRALQQITECCSAKGVQLDSHDSDDGGGGGSDYCGSGGDFYW